MKNLKKILASLTAVFMMLLCVGSVTASAANGSSITIKTDEIGHTYEAYQIFKGTISDGKLVDISWGDNINTSTIIAALEADETEITVEGTTVGDYFTDALKGKSNPEAYDIAILMSGITNDSAFAQALASIFEDNLKDETDPAGSANSPTTIVSGESSYKGYVINGLAAGYYLVKDQDNSLGSTVEGKEDKAYTRFILEVVGNETVTPKADTPSITKKIVEGTSRVDQNNAAIGDTVTYELKSKVPTATADYNIYKFVVTDKLSMGLTFDEIDSIMVGSKILDTSESETIDYILTVGTYDSANGTTIKIVFKNFKQYTAGDDVIITLKATVNDNAVIGEAGNPNEVKLDYTNNPNYEYHETTDDFSVNEPKGNTPWDVVETYVTEVEIDKVAETTDGTALSGAIFKVEGTALNQTLVTGKYFEVDAAGSYWKLTDGTYTLDDPSTEGMDITKYVDTTTKYSLKTKVDLQKDEHSTSVDFTAEVGSDGKLKLTGLKAGTYTITEIKAPDGYNALSTPITLTITMSTPVEISSTEATCTWTYAWTGGATGSDGTVKVVNNSGSTLPTTGGMGTTILYVAGGILVIGAAIFFVTNKRMQRN